MTSIAITDSPVALDAKTLLHRIDRQLRALRRSLAHDHGDAVYWAALGTSAPRAQRERHQLRQLASLLHVERAAARGRIHCTWFATLDEQAAWLASMVDARWRTELDGLPPCLSLAMLRAGKLA